MDGLTDHGYELIGTTPTATRPDGLDPLEQERLRTEYFGLDPDPLDVTAAPCAGCAYEDGFAAGVAHERARIRRVDHLAAVMLAAAIVALVVVAYVVGQASRG